MASLHLWLDAQAMLTSNEVTDAISSHGTGISDQRHAIGSGRHSLPPPDVRSEYLAPCLPLRLAVIPTHLCAGATPHCLSFRGFSALDG